MSRREDVFKDIDDTNTQTLSDLQQAIEPQACIDMYNKYKDLRTKTFDDAFDNEFIQRHAYTPTRYEYVIYNKVCGISDIVQKDRVFHRVIDILRDNLNAIHDEYNRITIGVSLLSKPERIEFETEDELLEQLTPAIDGLIIRDGNFQSVFLPDVWEQLPDKHEFLGHLKLKAGLPKDYFSESLEAFKFNTVKIA